MNAKELFSAAIRVIGLWFVVRALNDLLYVFLYALNLRIGITSVMAKAPDADLIFGFFLFFIGLYLLRGAAFIVNFAFPYHETETAKVESNTAEETQISE